MCIAVKSGFRANRHSRNNSRVIPTGTRYRSASLDSRREKLRDSQPHRTRTRESNIRPDHGFQFIAKVETQKAENSLCLVPALATLGILKL